MRKLLAFMALFTFGLAGCSNQEVINFEETSLTADEKGRYEVIGTQIADAEVSFDGEVIDLFPDEDGNFELSLYPEKPQDEVIVIATHKDQKTEVTLKIDNKKIYSLSKTTSCRKGKSRS